MKVSLSFKDLIKSLKSSLLKSLRNGTVWFGFLLFSMVLIAIYRKAMYTEWYNSAHGVPMSINPRTQAIFLMIKVTVITVITFMFFLIRDSIKNLKRTKP